MGDPVYYGLHVNSEVLQMALHFNVYLLKCIVILFWLIFVLVLR